MQGEGSWGGGLHEGTACTGCFLAGHTAFAYQDLEVVSAGWDVFDSVDWPGMDASGDHPTRGAGSFEGFGLEEDLLSISIVGCVDDAVVSEVQENRRRVESTGIRGTRLVVPCVMVCLDNIHFLRRDCEPYLFWGHHAKT